MARWTLDLVFEIYLAFAITQIRLACFTFGGRLPVWLVVDLLGVVSRILGWDLNLGCFGKFLPIMRKRTSGPGILEAVIAHLIFQEGSAGFGFVYLKEFGKR